MIEMTVVESEMLDHVTVAPNKALQRTRMNVGGFPWLFVCAAGLSR